MADPEELLKKAGGLFGKLGATLRQTSKQVTGLGRGTVRLELDRTRLAPGDRLAGRVVLALPEAVDARRLVVALRATQRTLEIQRASGQRTPISNRTEIFRVEQELGGAEAYDSRTLPFELEVPLDALEKQAPAAPHPIADAVRSVASALNPQQGPVEWSVTARLVVPWGRDLAHDVDIVISR